LDVSQNELSGRLPSCLGNYYFEQNVEKTSAPNQDFLMIPDTTEEEIEFTTKRMSYSYKGDILNIKLP
jgi:hypothetical protein